MIVYRSFRIHASRFLPNLPDDHICKKMHGHTFNITVSIEDAINEIDGFVTDFYNIDSVFNKYIHPLIDHKVLKNMKNMVRAYNEINQNLASHYSIELTTNGITGYLQSEIPIPVSMHSPSEISNLAINEVLPKNDKSNIYGQLINEIQMIIHDSDFIDSNLMNSLWVWGGGQLNSLTTHKLPTLYANDPIIKGCWYLSKSNVSSFNKSLEEFCSQERGAFVAVSPDNQVSEISNEEQLRISLSAIHQYQLKFKPERLILIFRDGWTADISTFHKYRMWRNSDVIKKIERNL